MRKSFLLGLISALTSCQSPLTQSTPTIMPSKYTNALAEEASPYLLQHAHNPVDWMPWGDKAFDKAKAENKLVLVSVGYSACHWCHVMEHESFEDTAVARVMNENFVCIKVDREERPDVDEIYMTAVQLMTRQGGWPLNCFTLPDGRPVYGGTYFPQDQWLSVLEQLASAYQEDPGKVAEYAKKLHGAIQESALVTLPADTTLPQENWLEDQVQRISKNIDPKRGGQNGAPKFPMPAIWNFMLGSGVHSDQSKWVAQTHHTLEQMAMGGIYDQIGGGFARYSTDEDWKVPHFEKMLYDNGQLISVYAKAYRHKKNPVYKRVVAETVHWLKTEMLANSGGFYAALDADSEGEEGKYYVWTKEELQQLLTQPEWELARDYFNVNNKGLWEHGNHIPLLTEASLAIEKVRLEDIKALKEKLGIIRKDRVPPGLDDKQITAWNALCTEGLLQAYVSFEEPEYLALAKKNLDFLLEACWDKDKQQLIHYYKKNGRQDFDFLEDYAYLIQATITAYQVIQDQKYLDAAVLLAEAVHKKFQHSSGLYTDRPTGSDALLISPTINTTDNVTPSANGLMAQAWYQLGVLYYKNQWQERALHMFRCVQESIANYPAGYVSWLTLLQWKQGAFYEVAITGNRAKEQAQLWMQKPVYHCVVATTDEIPMLKDKAQDGDLIFVCQNRACKRPVSTVDAALELVQHR